MAKFFNWLALFQLCALSILALTPEEAFLADSNVKRAMSIALSQDCRIGTASKVYLRGSGGFVGEYSTYIVGVGVHPQRANPQSWSIRAKVTMLNGNLYAIEMEK